MQWVNFIRDIQEDNELGRQYFPKAALKRFKLSNLRPETAQANPEAFAAFMKHQIMLYRHWQSDANVGFRFIPKRQRIPLATAVEMYNWTADQIEKNPLVVFEQKIKPSKRRVIFTAVKNIIYA